jgi:hypothetical protein
VLTALAADFPYRAFDVGDIHDDNGARPANTGVFRPHTHSASVMIAIPSPHRTQGRAYRPKPSGAPALIAGAEAVP